MKYLIGIHKQQKNEFVDTDELIDVLVWLTFNNVVIKHYAIEAHGLYKQPHVHAIVEYKGKWKHLTKYGQKPHSGEYFIHWKRITDELGAFNYIHKFNPYEREQQISEHFYKHHYVNSQRAEFIGHS